MKRETCRLKKPRNFQFKERGKTSGIYLLRWLYITLGGWATQLKHMPHMRKRNWIVCNPELWYVTSSRKKQARNIWTKPQPTWGVWVHVLDSGILDNYCRPLGHTPDPQKSVYEGNPFMFVFWGYLGNVPGPCWNFLRWWQVIPYIPWQGVLEGAVPGCPRKLVKV